MQSLALHGVPGDVRQNTDRTSWGFDRSVIAVQANRSRPLPHFVRNQRRGVPALAELEPFTDADPLTPTEPAAPAASYA